MGHIKVARKTFRDDPLWTKKRTLSEWEAWIWLLQEAQYQGYSHPTQHGHVALERGQLLLSYSRLASEAQWSDKAARLFLDWCIRDGRLTKVSQHKAGNVYAIPNYDAYQTARRAPSEGQAEGQDQGQDQGQDRGQGQVVGSIGVNGRQGQGQGQGEGQAPGQADGQQKETGSRKAGRKTSSAPTSGAASGDIAVDPHRWDARVVSDRVNAALKARGFAWGRSEWVIARNTINPKSDDLRYDNLTLERREQALAELPAFLLCRTSAVLAAKTMRDLITCAPGHWTKQAAGRRPDGAFISIKEREEKERRDQERVREEASHRAAEAYEAARAARRAKPNTNQEVITPSASDFAALLTELAEVSA